MHQERDNLKEKIEELQERLFSSEEENALIQAALGVTENSLVSDKVLRPSEGEGQKDLADFVAVARTIVAGVAAPNGDMTAYVGSVAVGLGNPTPLDLSFAWERFQRERGDLRRQQAELQSDLDDAKVQARRAHAEVQKLLSELATAQAAQVQTVQAEASEELQLNAHAPSTERSKLLDHVSTAHAATAQLKASEVRVDLVTAQQYASDAEALAATREALQQATQELEALRRERDCLDTTAAEAAFQKADVGDGKVLHLLRRPGGVEEPADVATIARPLAPTHDGDLERAQALRQLERFKRATKKYVQDFRAGIYGLLGWKVEMRGEASSTMRWHLTSRYNDGQELVFQLRPAAAEHAAEYDLLASAWAEQLQEDRQAMACLDMYKSVPGLLAHLTSDLLSQQTLQG